MKETVTKMDYFSMNVPDKPAEAARVLKALDEAGVNLIAFTGFPNGRRGQLDFVPENPQVFKDVAKRIKLKLNPKKSCFIIQGEDQRGAIGGILSQLGEAKINVTAIDAVSAGGGRYGAILWVPPRDVNKAAKVFGVT